MEISFFKEEWDERQRCPIGCARICGRLNFEFEINQISKVVSQMCICIGEYVVQFTVITKEWSSDSISLQDSLIGILIMWFWLEHQIFFNLVEGWIEDPWNRITMNLWLWTCYKFYVLRVLHALCIFFVFFAYSSSSKVLWWKFFWAFEAWIYRGSLIYNFLKFLVAFELDFSKL